MPGNLQTLQPAASGLMPFCTAFSESREYAELQSQYHDGTVQRSQLASTSRRTSNFGTADGTKAAALKTFWDGQDGAFSYSPSELVRK
jgi:hypothetical protein